MSSRLCSSTSAGVQVQFRALQSLTPTLAQAHAFEVEFFFLTLGMAAWCYSSLSQRNPWGVWCAACSEFCPVDRAFWGHWYGWKGRGGLLGRSYFCSWCHMKVPQATVTPDVSNNFMPDKFGSQFSLRLFALHTFYNKLLLGSLSQLEGDYS